MQELLESLAQEHDAVLRPDWRSRLEAEGLNLDLLDAKVQEFEPHTRQELLDGVFEGEDFLQELISSCCEGALFEIVFIDRVTEVFKVEIRKSNYEYCTVYRYGSGHKIGRIQGDYSHLDGKICSVEWTLHGPVRKVELYEA